MEKKGDRKVGKARGKRDVSKEGAKTRRERKLTILFLDFMYREPQRISIQPDSGFV
jgi:hypothetical protein